MNKEAAAVPGFLGQEAYSSIYYSVETTMNFNTDQGRDAYSDPFIQRDDSPFIMFVDDFEDTVYESIQADVEGCFDVTVAKPEIMFARLNKKIDKSNNFLPKLDNVSRKNEAVLVVQLDSTISWQMHLNGKNAYTERNMGMFFPDPENVTWSLKDEFTDNDYLDLLICRLSIEG
jgi:hypothetical protein